MKILLTLMIGILLPPVLWMGNFNEALEKAKVDHKDVLINFSGSDWCGPCIRLRSEILESAAFEDYATRNLVLVRADFPRQKKNRLPADQVKLNEALAEKYNPEGKFPFTVLVNEEGKVIKAWDGYPDESPDQFVADLSSASAPSK